MAWALPKNADGEFKSSCSVPRLPPERFPNLAQQKRRLKIFRRRFMIESRLILRQVLPCCGHRRFFFMFQHRTVELVHQNINGGVHILFNGLDVEVFTRQMDVCFSLLIEFFHGKGNGNGNGVGCMAVDAFQFFGNVVLMASVTSKFRPVIFRFIIQLLRWGSVRQKRNGKTAV